MKFFWLVIVIVTLWGTSRGEVLYQAGLDNPLLDLGAGARALGMGSSFVAIADDGAAGYWNPAGLTTLSQGEFQSMFVPLFEATRYYYLSYSQPVGSRVGLSVSWMMITSSELTNREVELAGGGRYRRERGNVIYRERGEYVYMGNAVMLGVGVKVLPKVKFGIGVKGILKNQANYQGKGLGIDLGVLYTPLDRINLGLSLRDATVTRIKWTTGGEDLIVSEIRLGVASKVYEGKGHRFIISGEIEQKLRQRYRTRFHIGGEWLIGERVFLRAGFDEEDIVCGGGVCYKIFQLDYAYVTHPELKNTHRVSLKVKIQK
jgi:hypothetical protein